MNGLLRIRQRYQGLAQSDKKLADYLLHFFIFSQIPGIIVDTQIE